MADINGMPSTSVVSKDYTTFSGIDIVATVTVNNVPIQMGTLQSISFSITREKAPLYTMGQANPRAFSRGKRGLAGAMTFLTFDKHALSFIMEKSKYVSKASDKYQLSELNTNGSEANSAYLGVALNVPKYADQIPAFDVVLNGANEYGQVAFMAILGCEILNEGTGISIDDITSELQCTYVARSIKPWVPIVNKTDDTGANINTTINASTNVSNFFGSPGANQAQSIEAGSLNTLL